MSSEERRDGRSLIACIWALAFCWLATSITAFAADRRVALVIGNSAYTNVSRLANPRHDAADLSSALKRLGFEVTTGIDLTKLEMDASFDRFAQSSVGASLAVLYFAGHGVQSDGENYLVPVDARLAADDTVAAVTVPLHDIVKRIERIAVSSVILLDACRNNPFRESAAGGAHPRPNGLAPLRTRRADLLIGYATEPNAVAYDGAGRNSPYALALLRYIAVPRQEITALMREVRREVMITTRERQVPWEHSSLREAVFLVPTPGLTKPDLPRPKIVTYEQHWRSSPGGDERGRTLGSFKRIDAENWSELVQTSDYPRPDPAPVIFHFKQVTTPDQHQVLLVDRERPGGPMWVRLDFDEKKIYWRQGNEEEWKYIYNITASE